MDTTKYIGSELELFEDATNWKGYFKGKISPYINGDVLEIGAGLGGTTKILCDGTQKSWVCLEPDRELAGQISEKITLNQIPKYCSVQMGYSFELPQTAKYDTILYIDVIEHIEKDSKELKTAYNLLKPNGKLIILVPAFNFLYSNFDEAVGHYRRYTKSSLSEVIPTGFDKKDLFYLDTLGFFTSVLNKFLLKQDYPTKDQIKLWDKFIIPISKLTDKFVFQSFGKALIGVWEKSN